MWSMVIVDDDLKKLKSMEKMPLWGQMGIDVIGTAVNGRDGLELVLAKQPDLLIVDIYMPVMNGLEMLKRLRERNYRGKVIILSGYAEFSFAQKALQLQVSDYLSKPVSVMSIRNAIEHVLESIKEENERKREWLEMKNKLKVLEPKVTEEWVKSWIIGASTIIPTKDSSAHCMVDHWCDQKHMIMVIDIDRTSKTTSLTISDWHLLRFGIQNIIHEIINESRAYKKIKMQVYELHSYQTAVHIGVDQDENENEVREFVWNVGERILNCIGEYLAISAQIGFGTFKKNWRDIPISTEEAFRALLLPLKPAKPGMRLFQYDVLDPYLDPQHSQERFHPIGFYRRVSYALQHEQIEQAKQEVAQFIDNLEERHNTNLYLSNIAKELWTILSVDLYDSGLNLYEITPSSIDHEFELLSKKEDLYEWMIEKIDMIKDLFDMNMNVKHKQAIQYIINYVHENYDEDLTLADLAEKVYISRSYLSHIFKDVTGITFNTYLTRVRMEKARRLLIEGNYKVYEVAEMVGYKNTNYFSTLFKKYTGHHPATMKHAHV